MHRADSPMRELAVICQLVLVCWFSDGCILWSSASEHANVSSTCLKSCRWRRLFVADGCLVTCYDAWITDGCMYESSAPEHANVSSTCHVESSAPEHANVSSTCLCYDGHILYGAVPLNTPTCQALAMLRAVPLNAPTRHALAMLRAVPLNAPTRHALAMLRAAADEQVIVPLVPDSKGKEICVSEDSKSAEIIDTHEASSSTAPVPSAQKKFPKWYLQTIGDSEIVNTNAGIQTRSKTNSAFMANVLGTGDQHDELPKDDMVFGCRWTFSRMLRRMYDRWPGYLISTWFGLLMQFVFFPAYWFFSDKLMCFLPGYILWRSASEHAHVSSTCLETHDTLRAASEHTEAQHSGTGCYADSPLGLLDHASLHDAAARQRQNFDGT